MTEEKTAALRERMIEDMRIRGMGCRLARKCENAAVSAGCGI
ncbi:hypothetical protein [Sinorhizobium meliloti]|nr:hypothetical protein [Sinorhizobium meliloti]